MNTCLPEGWLECINQVLCFACCDLPSSYENRKESYIQQTSKPVVMFYDFISQRLSCKFKVLQMVNCIQHKTDLSLIYTDVMLYCYRRAGKCSKADAEWTSFFEYNFKQHAVGLKLRKLLKWEHFKLSHAIKLMLIQSITTQVSEYGVVIHVCGIKSLPFDQWRKKIKIIFSRYLEKVYSNNQHTYSQWPRVSRSVHACCSSSLSSRM